MTEEIDDINRYNHKFDYQFRGESGGQIQDLERTIKNKTGNCVEYSIFVANWLIQHTSKQPKIAYYLPSSLDDGYAHVNIFAGGKLYDNGRIINTNPETFSEKNSNFVLANIDDRNFR